MITRTGMPALSSPSHRRATPPGTQYDLTDALVQGFDVQWPTSIRADLYSTPDCRLAAARSTTSSGGSGAFGWNVRHIGVLTFTSENPSPAA
jgi:hypothetical protein